MSYPRYGIVSLWNTTLIFFSVKTTGFYTSWCTMVCTWLEPLQWWLTKDWVRNDCSLPFTCMETIQHQISKWQYPKWAKIYLIYVQDFLSLDFVNANNLHWFRARLEKVMEEKSNQGCWIKSVGIRRGKLLELQRMFSSITFVYLF